MTKIGRNGLGHINKFRLYILCECCITFPYAAQSGKGYKCDVKCKNVQGTLICVKHNYKHEMRNERFSEVGSHIIDKHEQSFSPVEAGANSVIP